MAPNATYREWLFASTLEVSSNLNLTLSNTRPDHRPNHSRPNQMSFYNAFTTRRHLQVSQTPDTLLERFKKRELSLHKQNA